MIQAAVCFALFFVVIYGLILAAQPVWRKRQWRTKIARAHEPRPFGCLCPQRCGSDGKTCLHRGCSFGGR